MKKLYPLRRFLLTTLFVAAALLFSNAQPLGWSHLLQIDVTENSGTALTNYQVKFILNTQALIAAGQMNADGSDMRFGPDCNGSSFYNYFIESGINTANTVVWVKVPSIPASGTARLYMYYGNAGATSASAYQTVFSGPNSITDSVTASNTGSTAPSQRGIRFSPNVDILVGSFGKFEPNGTSRFVTLFDDVSQGIIQQQVVAGTHVGAYDYTSLPAPIWLTAGTVYVMQMHTEPGNNYYTRTTQQIGEDITYMNAAYCNGCDENTYPGSTLPNAELGLADMWYYTKKKVTPEPTYAFTTISMTLTPSGPTSFCPGGSVDLTASGVNSYVWSTTETTPTITVNTTNTYTVTGTDINGCTVTASQAVNVFPAPVVNLGGPYAICGGGNVILDAGNAGSTYLWNDFVTTTQTYNATTGGTYSVTVTDGNTCTGSGSAVVNQFPSPTISFTGATGLCTGTTGTLTALAPGSTFVWNTGATTPDITVSPFTTYSVTATDGNGCTASATQTISALSDFTVTGSLAAGDNTLPGQRLTRDGTPKTCSFNACPGPFGTSGYFYDTYTVANNGPNPICINVVTTATCTLNSNFFTIAYAGTFDPNNICTNYLSDQGSSVSGLAFSFNLAPFSTATLVVLDPQAGNAGCASYTLQVTGLDNLAITPDDATTFCSGSSVNLTASGGTSYNWSTGETTPTINVTTSNTYTVSSTNVNNCSATASQVVTVNPTPVPSNVTGYTLCEGFSIPNGQGLTGTPNAINGNTRVVYFNITNQGGDEGTSSPGVTIATINLPGLPAGAVVTNAVVNINGITLQDLSWASEVRLELNGAITNPGAQIAITQDVPNPFDGSFTIPNASIPLAAGAVTMSYYETFNDIPTQDALFPATGTLTITYDLPGSLVWYTASTGGSPIGGGSPFDPLSGGPAVSTTPYFVANEGGKCASARIQADLTVNPKPVVNLGGPYVLCPGDNVTLDAGNAGSSYIWNDGTTTTQTFFVNAAGTYSVTVTDGNTCTGEGSATVTTGTSPVVDLGGPYEQCGGTVTLDAGSFSGYNWSTGASTQTISAGNGTFQVTVTDANGCTGSDTTTVTIDPVPDVNQPAGQSVCNGASTNAITFSGSLGNTTYNWTNNTPSIGLAASGTGNIAPFTATNGTASPVTATVTVTPVTAGITPELLYYKFDGGGASVPNLASSPPAGTANATIMGGITQGSGGICSGSLIGSGASSTTDYLNTGWATNLSGSWSISFKAANLTPAATLYYAFGDNTASSFRCFTNGLAGANNWILRGTGITDVTVPGGAAMAAHTTTFVYDAGANEIRGYLDGALVTTVAQAGPLTFLGAGPFKVMGYNGNVGFPAGAIEDEFMLFNRVMTPTEISNLAGSCNNGGCTGASKTFSITVNPSFTPVITGNTSFCSGSSTTLDAGVYTTYSWSTGSTSQTTVVNTAGPVSVTVTDASGCIGTATVNTTLNPSPVVNLGGPYTQCSGTVLLNAGNAGSTYIWNDGVTTTQTKTAASTGIYSVTVTNASTCTASGSASVTINPTPVVDLGGPYVQCGGIIALDPGFFPGGYTWSTGTHNQTLIVVSSGTYSVTVSDGNGCTGSGSADVTIYTPPAVDLGGPYQQCQGTVTLDAGSFPGATYMWSDGITNTQTLVASSTGDYSVTVTDINNCTGESTASVIIDLPPLNTTGYTICQDETVPAGEGLTASGCGVVAPSFAGRLTLNDPVFHRGGTGVTYNPSGVGTATHYVIHTFEVGTTGNYTFTMCGNFDVFLHIYQTSFNPAFPATNFMVGADFGAACPLGAQTTVTLTAGVEYVFVATAFGNNNVGDYTVTFTGAGPVYEGPLNEVLWFNVPTGGPLVGTGSPFNPVGTSTLPNTSTPGTYTFYAACPNSPDCRTPVTFVINPGTSVDLGGNYNQCGGSVTLDAGAGNTTYNWSDGHTTQTIVASTSGTYSVTVNNSFNCSATGTSEIYIKSVPVVNLGLDRTQCGGTITLDAGNPGDTFHWSDNSTGQTLTVNATGTYSVTVGDMNTQCTASDAVDVTINGSPVVNLGGPYNQCGGSVTLDAGNAGATYLWSTNETTQAVTVNTTGVYRVTVTNAFNCSSTASASVTINAYPNLGPDKADSVCPGFTVDLNSYYANVGYASYVWNSATPTNAPAGSYMLIVNTAAGCADTANVVITNRQQPDLGPDLADSICNGYTYDLWALYPNSGAYASYAWNTPTPQQVTAGTYTLIVSNTSGCRDTLVATITIRQQPNLGPDQADSICVGDSLVDLTAYFPNNGYDTYVWNTATPDSAGPGVYTLIVSYASGCMDTAVMTVTYRQQPIVTLNMPTGMCYTEPAFVLTGGMPAGGTYVVDDSIGVTTFDPIEQGIGVHHINYIFTNASGCTDSASFDFTVHPQPNITTLAPPDLCTGSPAIDLNDYFTPIGGVFVGFGVSQHFFYPSITGAVDDTITYYYTDQFGCMDTANYPISVKNTVHVSLEASEVDFTICRGDNVTFTASGAEFYEFFVNGVSQGQATTTDSFATTSLGNHDEVYVVGSNSCSTDTSESIYIDVITPPTVTAGPDTTITLGESIVLETKASGTGVLLYLWEPNYFLNFTNVPNPTFSGPDTTTFVVTVTDIYGCWGTDTITINVMIPDNILLPNVMTPDGDGLNDKWILNSKINLDGSSLVIFNRWGETVYEAESYTNDWDGTYKGTGKKLPDDTYYYVLKVPAQNNHVYKGAINILNGTAK